MKQQDLSPTLHKYRVMKDDQIIGQFSNIKLAARAARQHPGSVVVDVSVVPNVIVYRDGRLLEGGEQ